MNSLADRLDGFRYRHQDTSGSGFVREALYFLIGVALGLVLRRFIGRWPAALLGGLGGRFRQLAAIRLHRSSAAGAFVIVFFGWKHWFGRREWWP